MGVEARMTVAHVAGVLARGGRLGRDRALALAVALALASRRLERASAAGCGRRRGTPSTR